jgi:hypothetical protein
LSSADDGSESSGDDDDALDEAGEYELLMREAKDNAEHSRKGGLDAPQEAVILDSTCPGGYIGELPPVDSPVRSPQRSEGWYNAPDAPPFDLFPRGSEESKKMGEFVSMPRHRDMR